MKNGKLWIITYSSTLVGTPGASNMDIKTYLLQIPGVGVPSRWRLPMIHSNMHQTGHQRERLPHLRSGLGMVGEAHLAKSKVLRAKTKRESPKGIWSNVRGWTISLKFISVPLGWDASKCQDAEQEIQIVI